MHVRDSIIQSTTVVAFDKKLGYSQPNLHIITHKAAPALREEIMEKKALPHLRAFLNQ